MSILDVLADRVSEQSLFELRPLIPAPIVRSVWVTRSVLDQLSPDTADSDFEMEAGRLRRKLEGIVKGQRLVIGAHRDKACDMKRLAPGTNEVWEVRESQNPGIRIFFRFIVKDNIAATNVRLVRHLFERLWTRNGRDFWPVWRAEIRRCKAVWRGLFPTYLPHSGVRISDYLSNATGPNTF